MSPVTSSMHRGYVSGGQGQTTLVSLIITVLLERHKSQLWRVLEKVTTLLAVLGHRTSSPTRFHSPLMGGEASL